MTCLRIARRLESEAHSLVLGVRAFSGAVPWRSKAGNTLARWLVRLLIGQRLTDTQTGLRGIPAALIPALLKVPSSGYEFELDMLITAKHLAFPVVQEPIQTIYRDGNRSSHFNPLFDSMRIYMVLFRFSIVSVITAVIDNAVFWLAYQASGNIPAAQLAGTRLRRPLQLPGGPKCRLPFRRAAPLDAAEVPAAGGAERLRFVRHDRGADLDVRRSASCPAKLLAEGLLFAANFAIQRDFVFTRRRSTGATDWTAYYSKVSADGQAHPQIHDVGAGGRHPQVRAGRTRYRRVRRREQLLPRRGPAGGPSAQATTSSISTSTDSNCFGSVSAPEATSCCTARMCGRWTWV